MENIWKALKKKRKKGVEAGALYSGPRNVNLLDVKEIIAQVSSPAFKAVTNEDAWQRRALLA